MAAVLTRLFILASVAAAAYILADEVGCFGVVCLALFAIRWAGRSWPGSGTSCGTAAIADAAEMRDAGMNRPNSGIHLGRQLIQIPTRREAILDLVTAPVSHSPAVVENLSLAFGQQEPKQRLWLPKINHCSVFGASGCGKGAGILVTTLLTYNRPVIVLDPKGELYSLTAYARRAAFGRIAHRLDPYHVIRSGGGVSINPLAWVSPDSPFVTDCAKDYAVALVTRGQEKEPFFPNMSELLLQAFIAATIWGASAEDRHLVTVADLIGNPSTFASTLQAMQASDAYGGVLRTLGHQIAALEGKEKASILASVAQYLGWLNSPSVRDTVRATTFDPLAVKTGNTDLFVILPPERLKSASGFVRYLLTAILRRLAQGPPDESREVLVILDEIACVGANLPIIEEMVTLFRGWGVRTIFVWQSLGQLQDVFPGDKAKTFMANMSAQIFAKTNDLDTAKLISEQIGDTTVLTTSTQNGGSYSRPTDTSGQGGHNSGQRSESWSVSHSEAGRRVLKPEEILRLPSRVMVLFTDRTLPVLVEQVRFYDPDFKRPPRCSGVSRLFNRIVFISIGALLILIAWDTAQTRQRKRQPNRYVPTIPSPDTFPSQPSGPPASGFPVHPLGEDRNGQESR
ncbi:type IV secretory system conjugative DNA transfer family protein [Fimbriiglobus ruber]|uniref:type IV secretory system conjugative DNA transfer family protein n=1 Tax=Fimbriiglobus ruber TaxID=1908690 RepID=UPI00117B0D1A|nr:type IV secretory system conjugative DNA transfer family protein [Fimbriiglobus ruber]